MLSIHAMFEKLHIQTTESLQFLVGNVNSMQPTAVYRWDIDTRLLSPLSKEKHPLVAKISEDIDKKHIAIYCFEIISPEPPPAKILEAYKEAKSLKTRNYARLNDASKILYVGSSHTLPNRIREHLGFGFHQTYAMHLAHWAPKLGLQLQLHTAIYPLDSSQEAIQALEDCLWKTLKPMLGRQGQR